jgi:hypothetical protein
MFSSQNYEQIAENGMNVVIKFEFSRTLKQFHSSFLETVFLIRRSTLSFSEKNHENRKKSNICLKLSVASNVARNGGSRTHSKR